MPRALTEAEALELEALLTAQYGGPTLDQFIRQHWPHQPPPRHLAPLIALFERARHAPVQVCLSMPPGHAKTVTISRAIAWWLAHTPADLCAYATHSEHKAHSESRRIRQMARQAGVPLAGDMANVHEWRTEYDGGLVATGAKGLTGFRVQGLLVVDDPYQDRQEAESRAINEAIWEWFGTVTETRREGASTIVVHCVAAGEPVLMADGTWRAVEDVGAGESVAALEGDRFVAREVTGARSSGRSPVLRVETARKSLRVTGRHPFLLADGTWRQAEQLEVGDRVRVLDSGYGEDDRVDDDFAWLFGFMVGDGWVTTWRKRRRDGSEGTGWCVCVAASVYPELNERACSLIERYFGRRPRLTPAGYYRIDCAKAGRTLVGLGLVGGAHGKRLPQWLYGLKPAQKRAFLRGYADADGCVLKRCTDSVRVASVSRALINDVRLLAMSAGVRCGRESSFTQRVRPPHSHEARLYTCRSLSINFARLPEAYETITAISSDGDSEVFDLAVAGSENFIAGGFVVHNTRWTPNDLIGRLSKFPDWTVLNLPAIAEEADPIGRASGEALWPEMYPREKLDAIRSGPLGEWGFGALYQGRPTPRGHRVFGEPHYYDRVPEGCRYVVSCDPAATASTRADFSVVLVLAVKGHGEDAVGYVVDVIRFQREVPDLPPVLRTLSLKHGRARVVVEAVGGFKAVPQLLRRLDSRLEVGEAPVLGDKFTRAQPAAYAWGKGRLLVPKAAPWLEDFLEEVRLFTGVADPHDDQVDALSHGWNTLAGGPILVAPDLDDLTKQSWVDLLF